MFGLRELDRVLRGEWASPGQSIGPLVRASLLLAMSYGICMGVFGLMGRGDDWEYRQVIACMVKVPALFLLSILVTFPSLYVFNTLIGSKSSWSELAGMLSGAMGIIAAVLAGLGPIVAFFSLTTISYPFAILMNVAAFGCASVIGIVQLYRMINRFLQATSAKAEAASGAAAASDAAAPADVNFNTNAPPNPFLRRDPRESKQVFYVWTVLFAVVGMQMSWILRPFIGSPQLPFTWFRPRSGNFFEAVLHSIRAMSGG
ncbi:MAG: hypothetical protein U0798_04905 [Gemmataceae bacterium]